MNNNLTIFTTPKAFLDPHTIIAQDNAIKSWKELGGDVIILGDDEGVEKKADELHCKHIGDIKTNQYGTPLLNDIFAKAEGKSNDKIMCFINADIILSADFLIKVEKIVQQLKGKDFLIVGRRHNMDITEELDMSDKNWFDKLLNQNDNTNLGTYTAIDYFIFPKGSITLPSFAIGRPAWDNWTLWDALQRKALLIDATSELKIIHQNHGYSHVKESTNNSWEGPEADENRRLAGGYRCMCDIRDATHIVKNGKVVSAKTLKHIYRRFYQFLRKIKHLTVHGLHELARI